MKSSLIIMLLLSTKQYTTVPAKPSLQQAVEKGIHFLGKEGLPIGRKLGCIQCHHGPFTIWSQRVPSDLGYNVDKVAVKKLEDQLLRRFLPKAEQGPDKKHWRHTLASFLLLAKPTDWKPSQNPKETKTLIYAITAGQQKDGSWKPANQFSGQQRPKGEANALQTMWNIITLDRLRDYDKSLVKRQDKALKWLQNAPVLKSMDARAVRVLIEYRYGKKEQFKKLLHQLIDDQNDNGSWGWVAGGQGDAWATGVTLYVLSQLEDDMPKQTVQAAQSYLVKTQRSDGSWHVPTKLKPKLNKKNNHEVASFWGTGWSVMGLAKSISSKSTEAE